MTTKIGLLGDLHATAAPVAEALEIFRTEDVDRIWCTGDIAGYGNELEKTIELLKSVSCQAIRGNHDQWYLDQTKLDTNHAITDYLTALPRVLQCSVEGIQLYMVHASPPDSLMGGIRLLNEYGELIPEQQVEWSERLTDFNHDVLIIGHTHQIFAEQLGSTLVINTGSTLFNHTCSILTLPQLKLSLFRLSGKQPIRAWHWGDN